MNDRVLMYVTEDGLVKIEVTMDTDTVWLNMSQLCELLNFPSKYFQIEPE